MSPAPATSPLLAGSVHRPAKQLPTPLQAKKEGRPMENFGDEHHDSLEKQKQKLRSTYGICLLAAVVLQLGALVVIFWWNLWIYVTLQVLAFFFWMVAVVCRMKLRRLFFAQVMQAPSYHHHHTDVVYVQQPQQQAQLYAEPTAAYTSQPVGSFAQPAPAYAAQPTYAPAPYTAAPQPTYYDASQPPAQQSFVV